MADSTVNTQTGFPNYYDQQCCPYRLPYCQSYRGFCSYISRPCLKGNNEIAVTRNSTTTNPKDINTVYTHSEVSHDRSENHF